MAKNNVGKKPISQEEYITNKVLAVFSVCLLGVLVHCFFENIFEEPYMMVYFWAIAAMIVYFGFLRDEKKEAQT